MHVVSDTLRFRGQQPLQPQEAVSSDHGILGSMSDVNVGMSSVSARASSLGADLRSPSVADALTADVIEGISAHLSQLPGGVDTLKALQCTSKAGRTGCMSAVRELKNSAAKSAQLFNNLIYSYAQQIQGWGAFAQEVLDAHEHGQLEILDQTRVDEFISILNLREDVALLKNAPCLRVTDLLTSPVQVKDIVQYANTFGCTQKLSKNTRNFADFGSQFQAFAQKQRMQTEDSMRAVDRLAKKYSGFGELSVLIGKFIGFGTPALLRVFTPSSLMGYEADTTAKWSLDVASAIIAAFGISTMLASSTANTIAYTYKQALTNRLDLVLAQAADSFDPSIDYATNKVFENHEWA